MSNQKEINEYYIVFIFAPVSNFMCNVQCVYFIYYISSYILYIIYILVVYREHIASPNELKKKLDWV